ncbi:MAG: DUF3006 domain-containing protein [Myxococcota bacterium]
MQGEPQGSRVFIDRLEDDVAVVIVGEAEEVLLPRHLLPPGAVEGDWLTLRLTIDARETQERRRSVEERRSRLGSTDDGGDLDL